MQKAAARIFFSIFFFSNLSVRDINHCILWKQCEISLWLRKRYINCVCTQKTSSRSLMYHIRLSNNVGLSFLEEFGISGAGMEKGWDQGQRAYFMGEGKSLIFKAPSSRHSHLQGTLLSTCPAEWYGGERQKNTASRAGGAGNRLTSDPKVWGQHHCPRVCPSFLRGGIKSDPSDINASRNTCFAHRCEIQMPVLHLSPTF